MPETFTRLTPCVLMSPLSVAQYLPPEQSLFDLVIFDEASQITTWDAIGAIARGRQSIIVGDPKQLPPTNFFGRTDTDDENDDLALYEKDLPSILDEATAAGLPTLQLNWHYRSRDEALIAFSNHHYYNDRLVTFPSPKTGSGAVRFHKIDGVYARGTGRTNDAEARAIVRLTVSKLKSWLKMPESERPTLGIITFNVQQQELILDLLDAERRNLPELEWFFGDDREEPVIVKNLENIQGDERDVMLFSITFGPDKAGKLSMAFGAINRDGGEKRLNVAITRARAEFHIFASIRAADIDTSRAKGLGVVHLKNFLDYAERGAIALPAMDQGSLGPAENPFEESIADALRSKGWEVRTQIGVSGFRIDLGVVHPDLAGAFLAGVECDGATYHRSATARDRDQIREAVLRNLGWEILRIWSTDWFMRKSEALDRVDSELNTLLKRDRAAREAEIAAHETATDAEVQTDMAGGFENAFDTEERQPSGAGTQQANDLPASPDANSDTPSQTDPDAFYEMHYAANLEALVTEIVASEGPIRDVLLIRAVARRHGWKRAGRRIRERVLNCIGENEQHMENGNNFVWAPGSHVSQVTFRHHLQRATRDVSQAEVLGLIAANPGLRSSEDAALDLARLMGLGRLSEDNRIYLESCLSLETQTQSEVPD